MGALKPALAEPAGDILQRPPGQHQLSGLPDRLGLLRHDHIRPLTRLGTAMGIAGRPRPWWDASGGLRVELVRLPLLHLPHLSSRQDGLDAGHLVLHPHDPVPVGVQQLNPRHIQQRGQLEPRHPPPLQPGLLHRPQMQNVPGLDRLPQRLVPGPVHIIAERR